MNRKLSKFYVFLSWMFLIFMLLTTPMFEGSVEKITIYDKIIHMILFGVLNLLLLEFLKEFKGIRVYFVIAVSFLFGVSYVYLCEYAQIFVEGRHVSDLDFLAGVLGIVITTIYWFKNKIIVKNKLLS